MNSIKNSTISMIGVPLDLGAGRRGVDMGTSAIRCANVQEHLEDLGYTVHDQGDLVVPRPKKAESPGSNLKYLKEIVHVNRELCDHVSDTISKDYFPLVIGGDHSIAIGTLAGVMQHKQNTGVIWFDAHGDVNTPESSPSGNIHGMSLAVALGYGHPQLVEIGGNDRRIKPENVVIIGARSLDPDEKEFLKEQGVRVFTMHDIDRLGMTKVMEQSLAIVTRGTDGVHLSLDLDGLDPMFTPGVGTPVAGGISYRESHLAMEILAESGVLTSAEFVEVNPILDHMNKTANVAVDLMTSVFGKKIL